MKIYQLYRQQTLTMTIQDAWSFFSSPYHLNDITPDFFHVTITSKVPEKIYAGLMISYQMKAVFGIPMNWLSEVSHCDEPKRFVYEQRIGPFKFWSHEVCLTEQQNGILLEDIMFYAMPSGWLGQLVNRVLIADKLERIFDTRHAYLQSKFGMTV
ncbi:MAG: SRPBCC family protein [Methylobacter sp.]|nr:SRPBCC family protein [Methylobacter sp.]MDP2428275.1 SRPBCC family protein [Methylobacter sp.]MDP3056380.1 SRPBCC family protein [Methylobacter sp.]MDP3361025.1 SRPBCC family protein [Methylobacter sp.]MDZ4217447.1 SRPBCC family protein [Methylobacter sp.]